MLATLITILEIWLLGIVLIYTAEFVYWLSEHKRAKAAFENEKATNSQWWQYVNNNNLLNKDSISRYLKENNKYYQLWQDDRELTIIFFGVLPVFWMIALPIVIAGVFVWIGWGITSWTIKKTVAQNTPQEK